MRFALCGVLAAAAVFAGPSLAQDSEFSEADIYGAFVECQAVFGVAVAMRDAGTDAGPEIMAIDVDHLNSLGYATFLLREAAGKSIGYDQERLDAELYERGEEVAVFYAQQAASGGNVLPGEAQERLNGDVAVCEELVMMAAEIALGSDEG